MFPDVARRPTYFPHRGDLVLFTPKEGDRVGELIASIDWPNHLGVPLSHIGIVDVEPDGTVVVIHDGHETGVVIEPLATVSAPHGPVGPDHRCLAVIPFWLRGSDGRMADVVDKARQYDRLVGYDIPQLALAGVAALTRRLDCGWHRDMLWELVHIVSRSRQAVLDRGTATHVTSCTCIGFIHLVHRLANVKLRVLEPGCSRPDGAWRHAVGVLTRRIADVVRDEIDRLLGDDETNADLRGPLGSLIESITDLDLLVDLGLDEIVAVIAREVDGDVGGSAQFGRHAPEALFRALLGSGLVIPGTEQQIRSDLALTMGFLDAVVDAWRDGDRAPQPGQPVYWPLASLGLLLDTYDSKGLFEPYTV